MANGRPAKKRREEELNSFKWKQAKAGKRNKASIDGSCGVSVSNIKKQLGVIDRIPEDINIFCRDDVLAFYEDVLPISLMQEALSIIENRPSNTYQRIQKLESIVMRLTKMVAMQDTLIKKSVSNIERLSINIGEKSRKRWTPEEDEILIEAASQDDQNIITLCREFGRTPGAISSRITHLVGINRLSTKVAGRFVGLLNGCEVVGSIDGTVTRK